MGQQPRVLMITRNFPPVIGGMERLACHAYAQLQKDFDVRLLGPKGSGRYAGQGAVECPSKPLPAFLLCLQWQARRLAREFRPDLVFATSGLSALAASAAGRAARAPVITSVHGLDLIVPNRIYEMLFIPAIRRSDCLIANSRYTAGLAHGVGAPERNIRVLPPGVAIPEERNQPTLPGFRNRFGLDQRKLLLSVGRLLPRKGLPEFIRYVMPQIIAGRKDVMLVIIGDEPGQALAARMGETGRIREAITSARMESHVTLLGSVDDDVLRQAYIESDLMVFPVRDVPGDVEGFGMVALEAAAHGLPTAGFSSGGVPDAIGDGISGYLVPVGNYAELARVLSAHLESSTREDWAPRCRQYAQAFSWERYGQRLRKICSDVIGRVNAA